MMTLKIRTMNTKNRSRGVHGPGQGRPKAWAALVISGLGPNICRNFRPKPSPSYFIGLRAGLGLAHGPLIFQKHNL